MKIVINPKYRQLDSFIRNLPQRFDSEGETIYCGRNTIKRFRAGDLDITVKRYKIPLLVNQLAYTLFRPSKARRAYRYAQLLNEKGFRTPEPVAYIEITRSGFFYQGYFVSLTETYPRLMREFNDGICGKENILNEFAAFTVRLHEAGILHLDYSPGNILFTGEEPVTFSLIDLNRMRFGQMTRKQCLRNFDRLSWNTDVIRYIVAEYARLRGWDVGRSVETALRHQTEFFRKNARKQEFKKRIRHP